MNENAAQYEGFRIDWLEITQKWIVDGEKYEKSWTALFHQRLIDGLGSATTAKGRNGYTHAAIWHDGCIRLDWHYENNVALNMGWHWTFTGKANDVLQGGLLMVFMNAAQSKDCDEISCSRVDLAFDSWDYVDLRVLKERLKQDMDAGLIRKRPPHAHDVDGVIQSVNLNKMSSDVYARWYDKGAEQFSGLLPGTWTRCEFKLMKRHSKALFVAAVVLGQTSKIKDGRLKITDMLAEAYLGYVKAYYGEYGSGLLGLSKWGLIPRFYGSGGKMADSDHWLMSTVAAGVAKRMNSFDDPEHAKLWFEYWSTTMLNKTKWREAMTIGATIK